MSALGNRQIMAKNISYYMKINNKTRSDICEAIGVKYTTFSDWVKGNTYPRIDKIELMANYFGISKSDLVEEHTNLAKETYLDKLDHDTLRKLNDENIVRVNTYSKKLLDLQSLEEEPAAPVLMAAHNDSATDPEEQEKIYRDLAKLKRPNS